MDQCLWLNDVSALEPIYHVYADIECLRRLLAYMYYAAVN